MERRTGTTRYILFLLIPLCYSIIYADWGRKYLEDFSFESSETTREKNEYSVSGLPLVTTNTTTFSHSPASLSIEDDDTNRTAENASEVVALESSFEVSHPTKEPVLTLLVMLSGEFGNQMHKIIRAWGVAKNAEQNYGLTTRLVFHQQMDRRGNLSHKAAPTEQDLKDCILRPAYIRAGDFSLGKRLIEQNYFHELPKDVFQPHQFDLQPVVDYLSDHPELIQEEMTNNSTILENGQKVPRLMIRVDYLEIYKIVDAFYDDILRTFVFDDERCCGKVLEEPPAHDETVLHLRNFATELRRESLRTSLGFEQLDKDRIAKALVLQI